MDLIVSARVVIPDAELRWRFSRSGGPGGQHVNTSDTRVELSFDVARSGALSPTLRARALERLAPRLVDGVVTVVVSDTRSQTRNRDIARERLTTVLQDAVRPPPRPRRTTKPSRGAVEARLSAKKRRGETKRLRRADPD